MNLKITIFIISMSFALTTCTNNQKEWDNKVKSLCLKDGGVIVYENIGLTKEEYDRNEGKNGYIFIFNKSLSKPNCDFYTVNESTTITGIDGFHGETFVGKSVTTTYRKKDGKAVEKRTYYYRRGGDPFWLSALGSHPSSFGCDDIPEVKERYKFKFYSVLQDSEKTSP